MKRVKIFLIALVSVLLVVILGNVVSAEEREKAELTEDGTFYLKNKNSALYDDYDNLFCVAHRQKAYVGTYDVIATAEIDGDTAILKKWKNYSKNEIDKTITFTSSSNNKLAAIASAKNLPSGYLSYRKQPIQGKQTAMWAYWNTWVSNLPESWDNIFVAGARNTADVPSNTDKVMRLVNELSAQNKYVAEIHFIRARGGNNYQNLIITNPEEVTKVQVQKIWNDDNDRDGLRTESITVKLLANEQETNKTLTLRANDNWKGSFEGLQKYDKDGSLINYTIQEVIVDGYNATVSGDATNGFEIVLTNGHEPEKTKIKIVKEWDDKDDLDEYRPDSITLKLFANGELAKDADGNDVSTIVLKAPAEFSNTWECEVTNLFRYYDNGKEIVYTIKEVEIEKNGDKYIVGDVETSTDIEESGIKVITLKLKNTHAPQYDGYVEISGNVWLDGAPGKGNDINGTLGEEDTKLSGIKVTLKDKDGNIFNSNYPSAYTDDNGNYKIKVNYDNSKNVYKLYENAETVKERLKTAYIEFEYDGMLYTTVATAQSGENTSKAKENETTRNIFDSAHSTTLSETKHPNEWTDKNIIASTQNVISFEKYNDKSTTSRKEVLKYCNGDGTYIRTNPEGAWNEILQGAIDCNGEGHAIAEHDIEVILIQNVNLGLFEREQPNVSISSDLSKVEVTMQGQKYTYLYNVVSNGNEEDVELKAQFQSNGYYTYRRPVNPADIAYINEEVNVDKELLEVYVTYKVIVENKSYTMPITVNSIINTYDTDYTIESIVKGEENPQNVSFTTLNGGNPIGENELDYKQAILNDLNITVRHDEDQAKASDIIYIKYKLSQDEIRGLLTDESSLHNGVEINSYTTKYGETTLYAEQRTGKRANQPYGGYDYDSHPGNAGMKKHTTTYTYTENGETKTFEGVEILKPDVPEDDTSIAPSFILHKDNKNKILSGNVWEDSDTKTDDKFRLGDGKNENGKKVANVKVELYKVNDDGSREIAYLYNKGENAVNEKIQAVAYTNNEGYYSFGNENYSVVTDKYEIKFTYGDEIEKDISTKIDNVDVNARNYKSTIISSSEENKTLYNLFKNNELNYEWHLNTKKGYSIAVDDINVRISIEDLQYSNFENKINMIAYSKPFNAQVEFDGRTEKTTSVGANGDAGFGNELNVFDFGIMERAREDLFVENTIDYLKITLSNGQVLTEGNPSEESINYVKAVGFKEQIENSTAARKAIDKQSFAEIDAELIQNALLEYRYAIKVTNNSEKDIDYYKNDSEIMTEYYYFGTNNESAPEMTSSINELVDYVDTDVEITWKNADAWTKKSAEELKNQGLIGDITFNTINPGDYVAYTTTQFANLKPDETRTDYAYASRVLANQEENVFEDHIEILKIDAKVARTIKGKDDNGTPVMKQYKTGNYIPSQETRKTVAQGVAPEEVGMHEQDDNRVRVVVTVPTGSTNYITIYVIAGLVGLIVMVGGVFFIKKKVLTK